jgi:type II secretion system protein N
MEKTEKGSALHLKLIYAFFFVIVYIISVYFLFPYQKVKNYLEAKLSKVTLCDVEITDISFGIFSGIELIGVNFERSIKDTPQNILTIDELKIIPYYFSLLTDKMKLDLKSKIYSGDVQGTIDILKKTRYQLNGLNMKMENIDISQNKILKNLYNLDVYGLLNGDISLSGISKGIIRSDGEVSLSITKGGTRGIVLDKIGSGIFQFENMILPDITFKDIKVSLKKEQRIVNVKSLKVEGEDINATVTGNFNFSNNIKMSSTNIGVKFSISEEYTKKDDTLSLLEENFKNIKNSEGFYNIKIEGALFNPRIRNL